MDTQAPELLECGHPESPHSDITCGYGTDKAGKRHCYACCAEEDKRIMREKGKHYLYLCKKEDGYHVTNWPGSLDLTVGVVRKGRHNMARVRYDFRFMFEGAPWSGTQYGNMTQIAHCRRIQA